MTLPDRQPLMTRDRARRMFDAILQAFGQRVCYASDSRREFSVVPARDILTCEGCGREFHREWGEFCPDCTGAD